MTLALMKKVYKILKNSENEHYPDEMGIDTSEKSSAVGYWKHFIKSGMQSRFYNKKKIFQLGKVILNLFGSTNRRKYLRQKSRYITKFQNIQL